MAYEKNDFNSAIEKIKASRIKQRAFRFWLDYRDLRKEMDTLIKIGSAFCSNRTVWRNMNAQYGQGKIRVFGGAVDAYVFSATRAVSFNVTGNRIMAKQLKLKEDPHVISDNGLHLYLMEYNDGYIGAGVPGHKFKMKNKK